MTSSKDKCQNISCKLSYLGTISDKVKRELNNTLKCIGNVCKVNLIFQNKNTIGSFFPIKDATPLWCKSHVVYQISCKGCDASYVGKSNRHFDTRSNEHKRDLLNKKGESNIAAHAIETDMT